VGGVLNLTARSVAYRKNRIMEVLGATTPKVKYAGRNHMVTA
jgi:hypothetical protein